jgi:hypothetical protein
MRRTGETSQKRAWTNCGRGAGIRRVLSLEPIEDPQNQGAILRSATLRSAFFVVVPIRRASPRATPRGQGHAGDIRPHAAGMVQTLADAWLESRKPASEPTEPRWGVRRWEKRATLPERPVLF